MISKIRGEEKFTGNEGIAKGSFMGIMTLKGRNILTVQIYEHE